MSGICGIWRRNNPEQVASSLSAMGEGLSLYKEKPVVHLAGPEAGVGVAARFATQQIFRNDAVALACDADLLNERELAGLAGSAAQEPAGCRTAAILGSLYQRFGASFLERLNGSFSIVLWDRVRRQMLAAIDGFGINRLVYYQAKDVIMIASRVDALARTGDVDSEINPRAIVNVLNYTSNLAPETILSKVHRLEPGSVLIAEKGEIGLRKYWDMRYGAAGGSDEDRLSAEMYSVVRDSVVTQCGGEDPGSVGAFLSGGTDSSTVVGLMSRMERGRVKAFSIGFKDEQFNEMGYADLAAAKFNAEHFTSFVTPEDCFDAIPGIIRSFDEPYGNASAVPTYFCTRLAAEHGVKFMLAGDGGDELFGGNERYLTDKIFQAYQQIPRFVRKGVIEPPLALFPEAGVFGRAQRYIKRSNIPPLERYFSYHFLRAHDPREVFTDDFLETLAGYSVLDIPGAHYTQAPAREHLDRLLYVDVKITLADNDLPKVTCGSELAGIQTRFPFLDRRVAEFSGKLPAKLKVKGSQKRYLFKRAFRELLPIEIINKKKHGFGIPVARWLKEYEPLRELSHDVLYSSAALNRGYFKRSFLDDLCHKHETDDSTYYGDTLWTFLALELWHQQCVTETVKAGA